MFELQEEAAIYLSIEEVVDVNGTKSSHYWNSDLGSGRTIG